MGRRKSKTAPVKGTIEHKGRQCTRTLAELASALSIPAEELSMLQKLPDCPGRGSNHLYDVVHWREFADKSKAELEEMRSDEESGADPESKGIPAGTDHKKYWEIRKLRAGARMAELAEAKARGDVVNLEEAVELLGGMIKAAFRRLEQVPRAMAPELMGTSLPAFTKRIGEIHRDAIDTIFKGLETKKKTVWKRLYARLCAQFPRTPLGGGASGG